MNDDGPLAILHLYYSLGSIDLQNTFQIIQCSNFDFTNNMTVHIRMDIWSFLNLTLQDISVEGQS